MAHDGMRDVLLVDEAEEDLTGPRGPAERRAVTGDGRPWPPSVTPGPERRRRLLGAVGAVVLGIALVADVVRAEQDSLPPDVAGALRPVGPALHEVWRAPAGWQHTPTVGGDLLVLCVVATWIVYLVSARRARATVDVVDFMATMMPIGVLTAAPVALIVAGDEIWPMTARGWFAACLLAVLTGMIGHGLIAFAQRELPMATIGVIQVAQPAIAVCWSLLILGERVKLAQIPGMVLVIVGLVAFTMIGQRRSSSAGATVVADQHGELPGPAG